VLLTGGAQDTPQRHQPLRTTLSWSYNLLPETEQILFRRLGIFAGGCTLELALALDRPTRVARLCAAAAALRDALDAPCGR
jgi:predicted ATPase